MFWETGERENDEGDSLGACGRSLQARCSPIVEGVEFSKTTI